VVGDLQGDSKFVKTLTWQSSVLPLFHFIAIGVQKVCVSNVKVQIWDSKSIR
jgi:hypothetical protein